MEEQRWKKASFTEGANNCVELASSRHAVRDSKNAVGPVLDVPLTSMLEQAKAGRLDR